jgi:4-hydroxythreonine-4-phosphate dehydrogenase
MTRARLALSIGCPCGIGPEVSVVAAADERRSRVLLIGALDAVTRAAELRGIDPARVREVASPEEGFAAKAPVIPVWNPTRFRASGPLGKPTAADGAAQLAWVDAACDLARTGTADAMVTGPVSKDVIASSGARGAARFLGHTEHLQRRLGAREVVMAFYNAGFTTALVTTHLPLAKVPRAITPGAVATATYWLARLLLDLRRGTRAPRLAVCGLNPHAGEGGRLGLEEERSIAPGIALARRRLRGRGEVSLAGAVPAETAFRKANGGAYDGVVAMYHDQATIPMKLVGFGESVNVSLGLPIIRTSVDHGTGYDIAREGKADARGMVEAIALATRLARR